jgi:D-arabinose 5-phosphate isomerase GutQ
VFVIAIEDVSAIVVGGIGGSGTVLATFGHTLNAFSMTAANSLVCAALFQRQLL